MGIAAGRLTRQVQISKPATGVDALNQPLSGYEPHQTLWAEPRTQTGMGAIRSGAEGVDVDAVRYSWRIRYNTTITESMVLTYEGTSFDIKSVRHDFARKGYTDLICEQRGPIT